MGLNPLMLFWHGDKTGKPSFYFEVTLEFPPVFAYLMNRDTGNILAVFSMKMQLFSVFVMFQIAR